MRTRLRSAGAPPRPHVAQAPLFFEARRRHSRWIASEGTVSSSRPASTTTGAGPSRCAGSSSTPAHPSSPPPRRRRRSSDEADRRDPVNDWLRLPGSRFRARPRRVPARCFDQRSASCGAILAQVPEVTASIQGSCRWQPRPAPCAHDLRSARDDEVAGRGQEAASPGSGTRVFDSVHRFLRARQRGDGDRRRWSGRAGEDGPLASAPRRPRRRRRASRRFHHALADASRRRVDHAPEADVVVRVDDEPQVDERVLDFLRARRSGRRR